MFIIALECYGLGRVAYTNGDFYHTLMWMQEALDHLDTDTNDTSISKIDILDHLAYATSQVNKCKCVSVSVIIMFVLSKEILNMR